MDDEQVPGMDELKRKLNRVWVLDRQLQVFGANLHKYKSYPVSDVKLLCLEDKLGVRLPADYRQFLQVIGYGAGPYYGLYGPDEILREMQETYAWDEYRLPAPGRPFPFGRDQAEECRRIMGERREAIFQTGGPADGCIPICYEGCTFASMLVTAGELAGSVWSWKYWCAGDYYYNVAPPPPGILPTGLYDSTMSLEDMSLEEKLRIVWTPHWEPALSPEPTFLQWYGAWLDQCLSDLQEKKRA